MKIQVKNMWTTATQPELTDRTTPDRNVDLGEMDTVMLMVQRYLILA